MSDIKGLSEKDFQSLQNFYWTLIDKMRGSAYLPGWEKGVYPSDAFLKESLAAGEATALYVDGKIAAAMVLNHQCNDGYREIGWNVHADPSEVLFVHALGVMPDYQRRGLAKIMVQEAIRTAGLQKQAAVRLDVLNGNAPALRLYESCGFEYRGTVKMFYEDTGLTDYLLYELVL